MKIKLSLKPLQVARWETHEPTGVRFLVAPLIGERDAELQRECTTMMGNLDVSSFNAKVCPEVLKGWEGIGDAETGTETPCSPEAVKEFIKTHLEMIVPWIVRKARSLDHYRKEEVEAAKNV